jgi:hypothetical protein
MVKIGAWKWLKCSGAVGVLALSVAPGLASAQDMDGELRDFVLQQLGTERSERAQASSDLIRLNRELQENRMDRSRVGNLEAGLKKLEAEREFVRKSDVQLTRVLGGSGGLQALLKKQNITVETLLSDAKCGGKEEKVSEKRECSERLDLSETPFELVVSAVRPSSGKDYQLSVEVKLKEGAEAQIQKPGDKFHVRGAELMTRSELEAVLSNALGGKKEIEVDLKDPSRRASVFEQALGSRGFTGGKQGLGLQLFANPNSAARARMKLILEELGRRDQFGTLIGQAEVERKEASSPAAFNEKQREIRARQKVLEYLARNPTLKDGDPCEILVKAVVWKDLPQNAKQECAEKNPEVAAKKEELAKPEEEVGKSQAEAERAQIVTAMKAAQEQFQGLVQHCLGLYRNMNAQAEQKSIVDAIQPVYEQMLKQGFTSEFFAELIGQNALMQGMMDFTQDPGDMPDQARRIVDSTPRTKEGLEKLNRERESIARMLKISGGSLGMVAGASPMGLSDPALQGDPKVAQLIRYHSAATALLAAIDNQVDARRQGESARIRSIDVGSGSGDMSPQSSGVPRVGGARSQGLVPNAQGQTRPADRRPGSPRSGTPRSGSPQTRNPQPGPAGYLD